MEESPYPFMLAAYEALLVQTLKLATKEEITAHEMIDIIEYVTMLSASPLPKSETDPVVDRVVAQFQRTVIEDHSRTLVPLLAAKGWNLDPGAIAAVLEAEIHQRKSKAK